MPVHCIVTHLSSKYNKFRATVHTGWFCRVGLGLGLRLALGLGLVELVIPASRAIHTASQARLAVCTAVVLGLGLESVVSISVSVRVTLGVDWSRL